MDLYLIPPTSLSQGRQIEPQEVGLVTDVQIRVPEENLLLPPLAEVVVLCRVAPAPPRRPGSPLGELRRRPHGARVSSLLPSA
jgi:hypothetical protein